MRKLVECVPNFSEGRRPEVLAQILDAIRSVRGVSLIGQEMDHDHHRAVVTLVGEPEATSEAAFRAIAKAAQVIDLNGHRGEHPRMGATDVCPFVPLGATSMEDCVLLAHQLGERVGRELAIPVYFYEQAAKDPNRHDLAMVRKGEFEKLKTLIGTDPTRKPDCGPEAIHPTAGAIAIGARFFLVAYNVNLKTTDLSLAKAIAKSIRERDGGFSCVKSLGFDLAARQMVQVSMNMTDYRRTSLSTVFQAISQQAEKAGVSVAESEIVGLVPREVLEQTAISALKLSNFRAEQIIENRLEEDLKDPLYAPSAYLEALAAPTPAPGGGSASALAGALAAALGAMVVQLTLGKKNFAHLEAGLKPRLDSLRNLLKHLESLIREDALAYLAIRDARQLPKETEAEKKVRQRAIEDATIKATLVPLDIAKSSLSVLQLLPEIASKGNPHAITDTGCACHLAVAGLAGSILNVRINLRSLTDATLCQEIEKECREILHRAHELQKNVLQQVEDQLTPQAEKDKSKSEYPQQTSQGGLAIDTK